MVLAIYISKNNRLAFENYIVAQDGFFQWLTFSTLLFASIMCFWRANILKPFRGSLFSGVLSFLGIIFLLFAVDEISWFQRVFDFNSPMFFLKYNTKQEMNFHHLVIGSLNVNNLVFTLVVKITATIYFLVLPFLYPRSEMLASFFNKTALPVPRYSHVGGYLLLALMSGMIRSDYRHIVFEFGFYWLFVLMMYNPLNSELFSRKSLVR